MTTYLRKLAASLLAACLLTIAGCATVPAEEGSEGVDASAQGGSATSAAPGEKVITVMVADTVNPELASPVESFTGVFQLFEMVYEPLVRYGHGGIIEPGLAESWEVSEDRTAYTFQLRRDVKFSDGTDFNADSVVENSGRWNPDSFSTPLVSVEKVDDYAVTLTFQRGSYPVLTELSYPRPYRMAGSAAYEDGEFVKMIGTGPWMVESYIADEEAVMVPNPHYYGEAPKLDKIIIRTVSDGQARIMALQSGDADLSLADLPTESIQIVEGAPNLAFMTVDGSMGFYYIFNEENAALQDVNVRKAVNYALNKESIATSIFNGSALPAIGIFPPTVPYVTAENSPGYSYDVELAKQALAGTGYADSDGDGIVDKDGESLSLRLVFQNEDYPAWKYLCEYVQAEMKNVGIDIQLDQRDSSAYYDAIWKNRDFDLIIYRTYEDSWNPHGFLKSQFYQPEGSKAISWYDPDLNILIDEVLLTQNEADRQAKYDEIFTLMNDRVVCAPISYPNKQYAYNTRLKDLTPASTTYEAFEWQQIDVE